MLNISSSQPVSWPTAPPMPTAPVQAVPAVGAAPSSSGDTQTDSGRQGPKSQGASASAVGRATSETSSSAPAAQPAPLLPRGHKDSDAMSVADRAAENRIQNEQRLEEEQKAREKEEQKVQLKEVLASVWKASAAVVEVVLGREKADAVTGEPATVGAVQATSGVEATGAPRPASPVIQTQVELPGIEPIPAALRRELEPTTYTEQGAGSWEPLGAGSLVNQRV